MGDSGTGSNIPSAIQAVHKASAAAAMVLPRSLTSIERSHDSSTGCSESSVRTRRCPIPKAMYAPRLTSRNANRSFHARLLPIWAKKFSRNALLKAVSMKAPLMTMRPSMAMLSGS